MRLMYFYNTSLVKQESAELFSADRSSHFLKVISVRAITEDSLKRFFNIISPIQYLKSSKITR